MMLRAGYWRFTPSEIYTECKCLRLTLKAHSPKEPAGFVSEPAEVFLSYIPEYLLIIL